MPANRWSNPAHYCWGLDLAKYQPRIDWKLLKAARCSFVAAKATQGTSYQDPSFPDHVQGAYDGDIPMIGYHYLEPEYYTQFPFDRPDLWPAPDKDLQWQNFAKALKFKRVYGLAMDHEKALDSAGKPMDKGWISKAGEFFSDRMKGAFPLLPSIVYSSPSFIRDYAPNTVNWIDKHLSWTAFYPYPVGGCPFDTWETFWSTYSPPESMFFYWDKQYHANPPWLGSVDWSFWQFSGDRFKWPGITDELNRPVALDVNLFNGPEARLWDLLKFTPKDGGTPPAPPDVPGGAGQPDPVAWAEVIAMLKELKLGQTNLADLVHENIKTSTETAITLDGAEKTIEEIRGKFA